MQDIGPLGVLGIIRSPGASRFRLTVLLLMSLFMALEGYDVQIMGYAAPEIIKVLHTDKASFGFVFGVLQFGFLVGATLIGILGDKFGRKTIVVAAGFALGLASVACAYATSVTELIWLRGLIGVIVGAAIPNAIALLAEYAPEHREATWVGTGYVGYAVGNVLGGFLAAGLIPDYGWAIVFLLGGIAPILVGALFVFLLPESARFLALQGNRSGRLLALLSRIDPARTYSGDISYGALPAKGASGSVQRLFTEGRKATTCLLWLGLATAFIASHFLSSWLPTVIQSSGLSLRYAAMATTVFMVGGLVGSYLVGNLLDRFGPFSLVLNYALAVPCVAVLGWASDVTGLVLVVIGLAGYLTVGGQVAVYGFAAGLYPTSIRSTGVGWGSGIGRVGSIVGPVLGGVLLEGNYSLHAIYLAAAAPLVITTIALGLIARRRVRQAGVAEEPLSGAISTV